MSKSSRWSQDEDEYFARASGFVLALIAEFNSALKGTGLSKAKRKASCSEAVFAICNLLDQGWIRGQGKTAYPVLAFTNTFLNEELAVQEIGPILLPNKRVELHALVADAVEQYFDADREVLGPHAIGSVGEEVPDEEGLQDVDEKPLPTRCSICQGSGACFCIRKGGGHASGCPRCSGRGICQHCRGTGITSPKSTD